MGGTEVGGTGVDGGDVGCSHLGVFVGTDIGVSVGEGATTCVDAGVGVGVDVTAMVRKSDSSSGVSVGCRVAGLEVGLAVGEDMAVGV